MEHYSQAISEPGKKLFEGLCSFVDFLVRHLVMHSCPIFTRVVTAIFTDAGTRCTALAGHAGPRSMTRQGPREGHHRGIQYFEEGY